MLPRVVRRSDDPTRPRGNDALDESVSGLSRNRLWVPILTWQRCRWKLEVCRVTPNYGCGLMRPLPIIRTRGQIIPTSYMLICLN